MSSSLALDDLQDRSLPNSAAVLACSFPSSSSSWLLLESDFSTVQQRGSATKNLSLHHKDETNTACHAILSTTTSTCAGHEGLQLKRTVSEWSVLLFERSPSSSSLDHRDAHTPERLFLGALPPESTDVDVALGDAFYAEKQKRFTARSSRGFGVLRNAVFPIRTYSGWPCSMALHSSSYMSLPVGGGACPVSCNVFVRPLRTFCKVEAIPSDTDEQVSPPSSESTTPTNTLLDNSDAKDNDDNESLCSTNRWKDGRANDDDNNSNTESRNSMLAPIFGINFLRKVFQNVMIGLEHNHMGHLHRRHWYGGRRGGSGYKDDHRNSRASFGCWFSENVESLMSCTLQGIIVFVL